MFSVPSDCDCHSAGSVESAGGECNQTSGQCSCKTNVGGLQCDRCSPGYYNLSSTDSDGCQPCNCQSGTSVSEHMCDGVSGQCLCLQGFTGRDCSILLEGFYVRNLNIVLEAEDQVWGSNTTTLVAVDSNSRPFTGRGFARIEPASNGVSNFEFRIPSTALPIIAHTHCVSVRYAPSTSALVSSCLSTSAQIGTHDVEACANGSCSLDLRYILTVNFGSGFMEPLNIDSVVFTPQLDELFGNSSQLLNTNASTCLQGGCSNMSLCMMQSEANPACESLNVQASSTLYGGARGKFLLTTLSSMFVPR